MSPIDIYRYLKSFFKFLNGKSVFHVARDGTAILYGSKNCHWKMIPIQKWGQHQSQWILMKDAALDKDPQSIIFKVFIAVG